MIISEIQECNRYLLLINHLEIIQQSPKNRMFFKKFNSEFQEIEAWFTDQNSKPLEIEDKIKLTLIIR